MIDLYHDEARREELEVSGRNYIVRNLSRRQAAKEYVGVLEKVVSRWKEKSR